MSEPFERWLERQLARCERLLEQRALNIRDARRLAREGEVLDEVDWRHAQWYICVIGVGHGGRAGTEAIDGPPEQQVSAKHLVG